jgi:hypothetical protein
VFVATQADAGMKPRTSAILLLVDTLDARNVQRLVDVRTIPRWSAPSLCSTWAENLIWPGKDREAALPNDSV